MNRFKFAATDDDFNEEPDVIDVPDAPINRNNLGTTLGSLLGGNAGLGATLALTNAMPPADRFASKVGRGMLYAMLPSAGSLAGGTIGNQVDQLRAKMSSWDGLDAFLKHAQEKQQSEELSLIEEQRKQDVHEQQMRFREEQQQLDLASRALDLKHKQEAFELEQEHLRTQQEEQAGVAQQQAEQAFAEKQRQFDIKQQLAEQKAQQQLAAKQPQQPPAPSQEEVNAQAQHQYRQNVLDNMRTKSAEFNRYVGLTKLAEMCVVQPPAFAKHALQFDQNGNPVQSPPSPIKPALLGGAMGGGAAHFLFPSEAAKATRKSMDVLKAKLHNMPKGSVTAPTEKAIETMRRLAYRQNAPRLAAGAGLGLLGGLAIHGILNQNQ